MGGDTVPKQVSNQELPEGKGWHDLARPVVPYLLMAKELREEIGEQLTEADGDTRPEAWVDLDVPPGIREFFLDLIHHAAYSPEDGDFEASRAEFFGRFEGLDELLLMLGRWDEDPEYEPADDDEREHPYNLSIFAGDECVRTFPLLSFGDTWDFDVPVWFFHRAGVDIPTAYGPALDIEPSMEEMLFGQEDSIPPVALVFIPDWDEVFVYEEGVLMGSMMRSDLVDDTTLADGADSVSYELAEGFEDITIPDMFRDIPREALRKRPS